MVDVDHKARDTGIAQSEDYTFEQGLAANLHQCFWQVVGERLEACAQACCENHCLHHLLKALRSFGAKIPIIYVSDKFRGIFHVSMSK